MTHPASLKHHRRRRSAYAAPRIERKPTAMGHLFRLLRFLHMRRLARHLFRKPVHVADLYVNGHFVRELHATANPSAQ